MSIELGMPKLTELKPKLTVIGIGGAGGNAVNNMILSELMGVDFVAMNTDAQALTKSEADRKIQLGVKLTQGLGAGSQPEVGRDAAEETKDAIDDALAGCHMAFITAGMGGGTGTGAAPVVARMAQEKGILTVGVVTRPFQFEGLRRCEVADAGITELQQYVDTLIIIPNQNLFRIANEKTTFADAFHMADKVLHSGVRGVTDLMVMPGLINLDFADVKTVMQGMGKAMMGTGEAEGENRAIDAAEAAISNPLLDEVSMRGAQGVIINITGGMDLTLFEVDEAANHIRAQVDPNANIIVGSAFNEELNGRMRVSVVATGVDIMDQSAENESLVSRYAARGMEATGLLAQPKIMEEQPQPDPVMVKDQPAEDSGGTDNDRPDVEIVMPFDESTVEMTASDEADHLESNLLADLNESFVPPLPSMPVEREMEVDVKQAEADAFAEAAMANGSSEDKTVVAEAGEAEVSEVVEQADIAPESTKPVSQSLAGEAAKTSLFERMTGAFRQNDKLYPDDELFDVSRRPESPRVTTVDPTDLDRPAINASVDAAGDAGGDTISIGSLGPDDRSVPAAPREPVEIPAFLRRQVN